MHAIQPAPPSNPNSSNPSRSKARRPQRSAQKKRHPHREIAVETTAKLVANFVISVVAASALVQLWPHYRELQDKLQEINAEVKVTESRVNQARHHFNRYFDSSQTQRIMQENSTWVDPNQRQIILMEPESIPASAVEVPGNGGTEAHGR